MKVVGVKAKSGTYEGTAYNNVYLHCLKDDENAEGQVCEVVKVKFSKLAEVFGTNPMTYEDVCALIGMDINVLYADKYNNVGMITILDGKGVK